VKEYYYSFIGQKKELVTKLSHLYLSKERRWTPFKQQSPTLRKARGFHLT